MAIKGIKLSLRCHKEHKIHFSCIVNYMNYTKHSLPILPFPKCDISHMSCTVMIWRSWIWTPVRSNLGCVVRLSNLHFIQNIFMSTCAGSVSVSTPVTYISRSWTKCHHLSARMLTGVSLTIVNDGRWLMYLYGEINRKQYVKILISSFYKWIISITDIIYFAMYYLVKQLSYGDYSTSR